MCYFFRGMRNTRVGLCHFVQELRWLSLIAGSLLDSRDITLADGEVRRGLAHGLRRRGPSCILL